MSFSLISNLGSLESQSRLQTTGAKLNMAIQRLSSGLRINNSSDDAAGLAIANKYRSDIAVIGQGVRNANDGLSTLQTIDGGLSNISTLLDRAAVLSAQGASDTFTGNRDTLQAEFSKVIAEITRQSQNIGLNSGGVNAKALTTVIGGGTDSFSATNSNQGVQIDLSAGAVDATSLGIGSLNIGASTGSVTGTAAITALSGAETLTFRVADAAGALQTFDVVLTTGSTGTQVMDQINANEDAQENGIVASLSSAGKLVLTSSNFFTAESATATSGTVTTSIGTVGEQASTAANNVLLTAEATTAASAQALDFTIGNDGTMVRINVVAGGAVTADNNAIAIMAAINGGATQASLDLRAAGIYAISSDDAAGVKIVSTKNSFTVNAEAAITATEELFGAAGDKVVTAGVGGGGASGSLAALDAIKSAVESLGVVQGTVGAGQNRLQQAVDLATSQITNFQAAESRVRDADVAQEASNMSRLTVLQQAGVAALAQANQSSQAVLSLLR